VKDETSENTYRDEGRGGEDEEEENAFQLNL
jgi:hypothetical protein